jgi:hypothetical protein
MLILLVSVTHLVRHVLFADALRARSPGALADAVNTNNFGEAHYQQALMQEHPCGGQHFYMARSLFQQSCTYNANIFGDDAAETQRPRSNIAALLLKMPAVEDCPGSHELDWETACPQRSANCDMCWKPIPPHTRSLRCLHCDFDCCSECGPDGVAARLNMALEMARAALAHRQLALGELAADTLYSQSLLAYLLTIPINLLSLDVVTVVHKH